CPTLIGKKLSIAAEPDAKSEDPRRNRPGAELRCNVEVSDAEGDPLQITWDLRPDVADHPGVGGDWEPSVEPISGAIISTSNEGRSALVQLPSRPGKFRLFVYARDDQGNATTANFPILAEYPAPRAPQPDPAEREKLRRSLTL